MDFFNVVSISLIAISCCILCIIVLAIIKKRRCGGIILIVPERNSRMNLILGFYWILLLILNLLTTNNRFDISMEIMLFSVYTTCAIEFFYIGITKIQFRETGLIYETLTTKYDDIESYKWDGEKLIVERRYKFRKKMKISVKSKYREEIEKILKGRLQKSNSQ